MEKNSGFDDQMELPPGFRFHPTDEELITHYLSKKVLDCNFCSVAVGEVDMNKVEPWELPWRARVGEKEWYFFCVRDKKYPTGLRTNRATPAGYWKATGKDKEIFRGKTLVGMKKTLVFYKGRAPKGEKSNWVNHEYRLEGKFSLDNLPKSAKNDWVISRVFQKTSGGKKVHKNELTPLTLPPLIDDPSGYGGGSRINPAEPGSGHVHCFSNPKNDQENMITCFNNPISFSSSNPMDSLVMASASNIPTALSWGQLPPIRVGSGFQIPGSAPMQDQDPSIFRAFLGNHGLSKEKEMITTSASQETALSNENSSIVSNFEMRKKPLFEEHEAPSTSVGPQDLECMWSF